MSDKTSILLVDDEPDILDFLKYSLELEGYDVSTANSGSEAIELAASKPPSLILLDVMMPEMDGIETCKEMRQNKKLDETVIAFLTARNEDYSQIAGFDAGADDYISKPVKPRVLVSRIKGLLRRNVPSGTSHPTIEIDDLTIDPEKYSIQLKGEEIGLPKKEFELLALLASKPGKVFSRETILDRIWGDGVIVGDRTIDVHIRKLREKIGDDRIRTIKGVGYKFSE